MGAEAKFSREGAGGQKKGARSWGAEEKTPPKWMGLGSAVGALGYGERVKGQRGPKERSRGGAGGWGSPGNEIQRLGRPRRLPRTPPPGRWPTLLPSGLSLRLHTAAVGTSRAAAAAAAAGAGKKGEGELAPAGGRGAAAGERAGDTDPASSEVSPCWGAAAGRPKPCVRPPTLRQPRSPPPHSPRAESSPRRPRYTFLPPSPRPD